MDKALRCGPASLTSGRRSSPVNSMAMNSMRLPVNAPTEQLFTSICCPARMTHGPLPIWLKPQLGDFARNWPQFHYSAVELTLSFGERWLRPIGQILELRPTSLPAAPTPLTPCMPWNPPRLHLVMHFAWTERYNRKEPLQSTGE